MFKELKKRKINLVINVLNHIIMKNLLFLLCMIALSWACSSSSEGEPEPEPIPGEPKEYIVSLGLTGEIDIEESPLSKAGNNDLYGIQVYSKTYKTDYKPYAHGLFNDRALLKIKLKSNEIYKFIVSMVPDGVRTIWYNMEGYCHPFYVNGKEYKLNNVFEYNELHFDGLDKGSAAIYINSPILFDVPNIERYYGEISEYTPMENNVVSINMKRVCFGAKFIADGLTEGKLHITLKGAPDLIISHGSDNEIKAIFTFGHRHPNAQSWLLDDYSEIIPLSVSWEKNSGVVIDLINKDITFKRNILTTINIKVKDIPIENIDNSVGITHETGEMTKGENITIESGTGLDGNIDPV